MIIGHIGVAFIAKRSWPTVPLRVLLVATFAPDLGRLALIPFGVPSTLGNMYTHTLPWSLVLTALAAGGAWLWTRNADAVVASIVLVVAHCVLDIVSGTKALWPGSPRGWNLDSRYWQYEMLIECAIVLAGWWVMRPVATPAFRRVRILVALAAVQFAVLMLELNARPYMYRCLAYPFSACDDTSELTRRWAGTLLPNMS